MSVASIEITGKSYKYYDLKSIAGDAFEKMPHVHRILLENVLHEPDTALRDKAVAALINWTKTGSGKEAIPFAPTRILMHDTTCGPALTDIAAMRDVLSENGVDPALLNPCVPVATSTDHSAPVDYFGTSDALDRNLKREFDRNSERYQFMKWATKAVDGFRVFPPGTGIMHTINMERVATVVSKKTIENQDWLIPDTLIGTDSHTPMVNSLGVLGWGVGGLEAEGAMFGVSVNIRIPDVLGVRLTGSLREGVTATDLALRVTEILRQAGCSGEFVEYYGPGVASLTLGDRGPAANMTPEYGASTGYFPIDAHTINYLRETGRTNEHCVLVEAYAKAAGLWFDPASEPRYTKVFEIDLSKLELSIAGPTRPQDRLSPSSLASVLQKVDVADVSLKVGSTAVGIPQDAVAIAAITSCTNTTDTGFLIAAALLARKAVAKGLRVPSWVKTSIAPGSPAAFLRLTRAGLLTDLEALGFFIVGYGCTTCIGNSGPLVPEVSAAIIKGAIHPIAVLSGNRNFPGRVHAQIDSSFLMSPALVVAYAIAGRGNIDIQKDPLGVDGQGRDVHLSDLWPTDKEIQDALFLAMAEDDVAEAAKKADANELWANLTAPNAALFPWDNASTYLRRPPFVAISPAEENDVDVSCNPLLVLGDDVTTDHISPAGSIPTDSDAAKWLVERGENPNDLNVYSSRRGNWEVMLRGLFTNKNLINYLNAKKSVGKTVFASTGETLPVWIAASRYQEEKLPVIIIAGERYGTGSSRDWAAKGTELLGARAVLANSFERIHRTNLVGMGILPLRLPDGWKASEQKIDARDKFVIRYNFNDLSPRCIVPVEWQRAQNEAVSHLDLTLMVDTAHEITLLKNGGIISTILTEISRNSHSSS
ncbi:aconitate hydratase AcnA [Acetobacter thailandicus]|uniref:Aconitate hydratase n=1 Tax=Acetobacter thailandicus TaxID=1502842 RepID=A0ABT3QCN4_9PROT|nr:aconitate hydratase AcnA [Acetobacter thailandicus]MCX2563030.1 aconitate hydratase AcnA [Acetobacter thailandicus]NHN96296.1 aconitate hydratase AcnA [Acetobacter thailandicus]